MRQNRHISRVFESATTRLTIWYMVLIMALSLIFSFALYRIAVNDLEVKVQDFQTGLETSMNNETNDNSLIPHIIRDSSKLKVADALAYELFTLNITILIIGGLFSYILAKYSINPLQKAHERQSRFTSDASHELRTPLAVMRTELEVALSDKTATKSELRGVLKSNLEEVNKLTKLSEMLLGLSKTEGAKLKLENADLVQITQAIIKDFKQPVERFKITAPKQLKICVNETAIRDLVRILVENAIQYSEPRSQIKISISTRDSNAKFSITNTGAGIKSNDLPYIFDRFYRADSSRTNNDKPSYGLGLSLAKSIVELHHGGISARSKPGANTILTFTLPIDYCEV